MAAGKYVHLLRAMGVGDVIYLSEHLPRMDRQIVSTVGKYDGVAETACFVGVNLDPSTAHRIVRVTMIKPMRPAMTRGRKPKGAK